MIYFSLEVPAKAVFEDLPIEPIYTLAMDVSPSWLVRPREALYDLDNLQLGHLPPPRTKASKPSLTSTISSLKATPAKFQLTVLRVVFSSSLPVAIQPRLMTHKSWQILDTYNSKPSLASLACRSVKEGARIFIKCRV